MPLNFYFFPLLPPSPTPSWHPFFLCKPTGVSYFWELNVGLHLTSRISDIFTQFFTNLYTNGFKSWHENFEQNSTRRLFMGEPPFYFSFFSYIFLWLFFLFNLPSQISTEWAQNVGSTLTCFVGPVILNVRNNNTGYASTGNPSLLKQLMDPVENRVEWMNIWLYIVWFLHFLICTFGEVAVVFNHFCTSAGGHAYVRTAACFLLNVRTST